LTLKGVLASMFDPSIGVPCRMGNAEGEFFANFSIELDVMFAAVLNRHRFVGLAPPGRFSLFAVSLCV
jgi:hypothetical protein